jgi:hypothetical protein
MMCKGMLGLRWEIFEERMGSIFLFAVGVCDKQGVVFGSDE